MKNAQYRYLAGHQILNLKELTAEVNESFQHNKAQKPYFQNAEQYL